MLRWPRTACRSFRRSTPIAEEDTPPVVGSDIFVATKDNTPKTTAVRLTNRNRGQVASHLRRLRAAAGRPRSSGNLRLRTGPGHLDGDAGPLGQYATRIRGRRRGHQPTCPRRQPARTGRDHLQRPVQALRADRAPHRPHHQEQVRAAPVQHPGRCEHGPRPVDADDTRGTPSTRSAGRSPSSAMSPTPTRTTGATTC